MNEDKPVIGHGASYPDPRPNPGSPGIGIPPLLKPLPPRDRPWQQLVDDFHKAFGIERSDTPTYSTPKIRLLRRKLIAEELAELEIAYMHGSMEMVADALGDLLYVVLGAFMAHGLDANPIFREIHRSNMTKVGGHKREDGKWIKPDTYDPPNLKPFVEVKS